MPLQDLFKSRFLFVVLIVCGNAISWLVPSNVLELVAREQHVLCGRFSRVRFAWMLGVALISAAAIFVGAGGARQAIRRRSFALAAMLIGLVPIFLIADVALRLRTEYPYQTDPVVYHRPPRKVYHQPFVDAPQAKRSYPVIRPGFGNVDCTLTYDETGYRNISPSATCDIVVVGDSFTEGSRVSDDQAWPVVLAKLSGKSVYNLGISGYNPPEYLAAIKAYGLSRKPKVVICMLYEGNDFRTGEVAAKSGVSLKQIIRTSPLLLSLNEAIIRVLGPIRCDAHVDSLDVLSWMPIEYPRRDRSRYYAFAPKQITELNLTPDEFAAGVEWFAAKAVLRQMNEACQAAGARLVVGYAPNTAHVVFPLAAPDLPAEKVRAFAAIRAKKQPPEPAEFMRQVIGNLESRENVIADYCTGKSIPFVSMTPALREYAKAGKQPFYTYDQHWTPLGHEAAAKAVHDFLIARPEVAAHER